MKLHAVLGFLCCMYICLDVTLGISHSTPPLLGDIKSSSPSESPLMEKRELREAHCPILKQTSKETSMPATTAVNQNPSAQTQAAPEERRVAFDIGDSDDVDNNKEHKVAFDIGDSDDTDYSNANGGKCAKKQPLISTFSYI